MARTMLRSANWSPNMEECIVLDIYVCGGGGGGGFCS